MSLHADDVGEEVASGQRQILDDKVEYLVGVLNTRNRDVTDLARYRKHVPQTIETSPPYLLDNARQNDFTNVHPQVGLELETALAVEQQVLREASPILTEAVAMEGGQ